MRAGCRPGRCMRHSTVSWEVGNPPPPGAPAAILLLAGWLTSAMCARPAPHPSWHLPNLAQPPTAGLYYRPWLRTLTWLLFYAFSVFSFVIGCERAAWCGRKWLGWAHRTAAATCRLSRSSLQQPQMPSDCRGCQSPPLPNQAGKPVLASASDLLLAVYDLYKVVPGLQVSCPTAQRPLWPAAGLAFCARCQNVLGWASPAHKARGCLPPCPTQPCACATLCGLQVVMQRLMASLWLPPSAVLDWLEQHTQIRQA